jgi:hypothetical protein
VISHPRPQVSFSTSTPIIGRAVEFKALLLAMRSAFEKLRVSESIRQFKYRFSMESIGGFLVRMEVECDSPTPKHALREFISRLNEVRDPLFSFGWLMVIPANPTSTGHQFPVGKLEIWFLERSLNEDPAYPMPNSTNYFLANVGYFSRLGKKEVGFCHLHLTKGNPSVMNIRMILCPDEMDQLTVNLPRKPFYRQRRIPVRDLQMVTKYDVGIKSIESVVFEHDDETFSLTSPSTHSLTVALNFMVSRGASVETIELGIRENTPKKLVLSPGPT